MADRQKDDDKIIKKMKQKALQREIERAAAIKKEEYEKELKTKDKKPENLSFMSCVKKIILGESGENLFHLLLKHINENYRYSHLLGICGEGLVFCCIDDILRRNVAIKIGLPRFQGKIKKCVWIFALSKGITERSETEQNKRFIRGCKIQAHLSKEVKNGIIPAVFRTSKDPLYLEMEYIEGQGFFDYIKEHNKKENLLFFLRFLRFIEEIHLFEIIHRDIKPANILVTSEGIPVLLDFTVSKILNTDKLTAIGHPVGSPLYASFRQLTDAALSNYQDDIYSLGILLYCAVLKRDPEREFDENLFREKDRDKFLLRLYTEIDSEFKAIFRKATHKKESKRYKIVSEMIKDIENILDKISIDYKETLIVSDNKIDSSDISEFCKQFIKTVRIISKNNPEN